MTAITVTAQHLTEGQANNCEKCAVALAIRDAFPDALDVAVGSDTFTIWAGDRMTEVSLPGNATDAIWDIDDGKTVQPFSFAVDYPAATS